MYKGKALSERYRKRACFILKRTCRSVDKIWGAESVVQYIMYILKADRVKNFLVYGPMLTKTRENCKNLHFEKP